MGTCQSAILSDMLCVKSVGGFDSSSSMATTTFSGPLFALTERQRMVMQKHWATLMDQKPDICHRAMLDCIEASPKLNEIIACGRYCYRDLRQWPKLGKMCDAQLACLKRLLIDQNLSPEAIAREGERLGTTHRRYAQYGLKPHFLDLFQRHFLAILVKLRIEDEEEKNDLMSGWGAVLSFIIDRIYLSYSLQGGSNHNAP